MKKQHVIRVLLFLPVFFIGKWSSAQSIEFSAKASKTSVAADEAFKLIYSVNQQAEFTLPDLKDFKVLSGPAQSSYSQIQIINGQAKNTYSLTWTLIVRPKKEGEFTIPPATVNYNGKAYKSNSLKISVGKAVGNTNASNEEQPSGTVKATGKNVFCNISISKSKVYIGEPLLITYKLYSRYTQIQDYDIKLGTQKGVWSQEIPAGKQGWDAYEETVGGVRYMVYPIKKEIVYPQVSGKIKLEPFDMMVVARVNFFESQRFDAVSNSPTIEVLPTPANAPEGFSNAVGKFKLEASINKDEVDVNDGIDLKVKLTGSGNIKLIEPLKFEFPQDFEVYDPEVSDKSSVNVNGMSGSKEYKYLIIPRHSGEYTIAPVSFAYFDPETKNYIRLETPEFKIKVRKGEGEEASSGGIVTTKTDVEILDKDIRFIKNYNGLTSENDFFTGSALYYSGISLPPLALFVLLFIRRKKEKEYDPVAEKTKQAGKKVIKQLSKAQQLLAAQNKDDFYTELLKGISQYYIDKFNKEMSEFNRSSIQQHLSQLSVSQATITGFIDVIEKCEMAKYAPSMMHGNENATFQMASETIKKIEEEVKA
jgi:hypothetical protein